MHHVSESVHIVFFSRDTNGFTYGCSTFTLRAFTMEFLGIPIQKPEHFKPIVCRLVPGKFVLGFFSRSICFCYFCEARCSKLSSVVLLQVLLKFKTDM
jgi:hypothetical protein